MRVSKGDFQRPARLSSNHFNYINNYYLIYQLLSTFILYNMGACKKSGFGERWISSRLMLDYRRGMMLQIIIPAAAYIKKLPAEGQFNYYLLWGLP